MRATASDPLPHCGLRNFAWPVSAKKSMFLHSSLLMIPITKVLLKTTADRKLLDRVGAKFLRLLPHRLFHKSGGAGQSIGFCMDSLTPGELMC